MIFRLNQSSQRRTLDLHGHDLALVGVLSNKQDKIVWFFKCQVCLMNKHGLGGNVVVNINDQIKNIKLKKITSPYIPNISGLAALPKSLKNFPSPQPLPQP